MNVIAIRLMIEYDVQPHLFPSDKTISIDVNAVEKVNNPRQSIFDLARKVASPGRKNTASNEPAMANGAVKENMERQPRVSIKAPPITGPMMAPSTHEVAFILIAKPSCFFQKSA